MPIYCDESGGIGRGVMTLAAVSISAEAANDVLTRYRKATGLVGELKGSRIDLEERAMLFDLLESADWHATVGIAISALTPDPGEDRGDHDIEIYAGLLDDVIASMLASQGELCRDVIIDDGRYGEATLALVRNAVGRLVGPLGTASLAMSHTSPTAFSIARWLHRARLGWRRLSPLISKADEYSFACYQVTPSATIITANNVSAVMAKTDSKHIRQNAPNREVS
jgi:hypothetical protein